MLQVLVVQQPIRPGNQTMISEHVMFEMFCCLGAKTIIKNRGVRQMPRVICHVTNHKKSNNSCFNKCFQSHDSWGTT